MPEQTLKGKVAVVGTGAKNLGGSDAFAIRRARELQAFYALDPNSFVKLNGEKWIATSFFREPVARADSPVPSARSSGSQ